MGQERTSLHVRLLLAVCVLLFLSNTWSLPLGDPEEARCGLVVREMTSSGDWLMPHLRGEPYYDKPAPYFWLTALGEKLTGSPEFGGRVVSAIAATLAVLVTYFFARRVFNPTAGFLAGLILATSGMFLVIARWYRMEMPCAAAMWAALWWFWRAESSDDDRVRRRRWYGFYLLCAVATLMKGPIGLGLPVLIVGTYLLLSGKPRRILEGFHLPGILVYLLIAAPWYVAVSLHVPGYAHDFFIRQNLLRFTMQSTSSSHARHALFFLPWSLLGLVPWSLLIFMTCHRTFPRGWGRRSEHPAKLFLWLAVLLPLLFFTFSGTKVPHYILPVFPPLAVLVGAALAEWIAEDASAPGSRRGALVLSSCCVLLLGVLLTGEVLLGNVDAWVVLPATAAAAGIVGVWISLARNRRMHCVAWTAAAVIVTILFAIYHTGPSVYEKTSTRELALVARSDPSAKLWFWDTTRLSFLYYVNRPVRTGHHENPDSLKALLTDMASDRRVYVLVYRPKRFEELKSLCPGRFFVVAQSGGRWLVSNRPVADSSP